MGKRGPRGVVRKLQPTESPSQPSGLPRKRPAQLEGPVSTDRLPAALAGPSSTGSSSAVASLPSDSEPSHGSDDGGSEPVEYRHYLASPRKRGRFTARSGISRSVAVFPGGRVKEIGGASWDGRSPPVRVAAVRKGPPQPGSSEVSERPPQGVDQGLPGLRPYAPSNAGYVLPVGVPQELQPAVGPSTSAKRKAYEATTASRWAALLPRLVHPYLQWASSTSNGRRSPELLSDGAECSCSGAQKHLQVAAIYLDRTFFSVRPGWRPAHPLTQGLKEYPSITANVNRPF